MNTPRKLQSWEQQLQKLQLVQHIPSELRVLLEETIQACQTAAKLFHGTEFILFPNQKDLLAHQEAFQDLMRVEAQRNALWTLESNVINMWETTQSINGDADDEWQPEHALDAILEIKVQVASEFRKMSEVADIWTQRKAFNNAIRPFARPLTIYDIPNELWNHIFELIIGEKDEGSLWLFPDHVSVGRALESIKNVRLACRRFCAASSHLLFRRIDVALNPNSLARLDEISRHPTFSVGVRAVRIDLSCYPYDADLAQDELAFVTATIDKVCSWIHIDKKTLQLSDKGCAFFRSRFPKVDIEEAVYKAGRAVALWLSYLKSGCKSPLLDENDVEASSEIIAAITAVRTCYQEYQKRFQDQENRRVHGRSLARSVAEAVARMPNAVRFFITDNMSRIKSCDIQDRSVGRPIVDLVRDLNLLVRETMLEPSTTWDNLMRHGSDIKSRQVETDGAPPPSSLLVLLPMALQEAHVPLRHLEINISWNRYATWELGEDDVSSFLALARTLQVFDYHGPPDFPYIQGSSMREYLSAFISGENLQEFGVEFRLERAETMAIGPVLASLSPGAGLRSVRLCQCSLHLDQLESLLQKCNANNSALILHGVRLLSGAWADALDVLRHAMSHWASVVSIQRPTGAECDNMSREKYNAVFGSGRNLDGKMSKANKYVSEWFSKDIHNPLRPEAVEDDAPKKIPQGP